MKNLDEFAGKSQFDDDIDTQYQPSACGPVTAYTILNYYLHDTAVLHVNDLYRQLGGTKIGLFKWRFVRNLQKLLGSHWLIEECGIEELQQEIDEGRPVAAKFDKWFTFHWFRHFSYDYHWVPIVGYKKSKHGIILIAHDNGGRNRESRLREIPYGPNRKILSFIKIQKTTSG